MSGKKTIKNQSIVRLLAILHHLNISVGRTCARVIEILKNPVAHNAVTSLATVVIALCTGLYWFTTEKMLDQMSKQNAIQSDYYKKTVRPFVYSFSLQLQSDDGENATIQYSLLNVGGLPAKDVMSVLYIDDKVERDFSFLRSDSNGVEASLFPNQENTVFVRNRVSFDELRKNPYAYTHIRYKDFGEQEYYYKSIHLIQGDFQTGKPYKVSTIWVDFN